ncbi:MAG: nitroreductase family protein [Hirschia sp.]|nr:nitroreductase family protein [Hirschia sp.]MBF18385.1 nitroreductase family protein [Hirschia sp.]
MDVTSAVKHRRSIRAFKDTPISREELTDLLTTAQRSPSGCNLQPWRVIAVSGQARADVVALAHKRLAENPEGDPTDYPIILPDMWEPYKSRYMRIAAQMSEAANVERSDKEGRARLMARQFDFFDAPVGLFYIVDERFEHGQWGHTGMYMQTVALLAEERGWGTCFQEFWGLLRTTLKAHFQLGEHEMVWCGMAMGHPDWSSPMNNYRTERAPLDEVVDLRGF